MLRESVCDCGGIYGYDSRIDEPQPMKITSSTWLLITTIHHSPSRFFRAAHEEAVRRNRMTTAGCSDPRTPSMAFQTASDTTDRYCKPITRGLLKYWLMR